MSLLETRELAGWSEGDLGILPEDWFDVYQWQQEMLDSTTATFEALKHPDVVSTASGEGKNRPNRTRAAWNEAFCRRGRRQDRSGRDADTSRETTISGVDSTSCTLPPSS